MIVKLVRPKAEHVNWQIYTKEGTIARYVPKNGLPERVASRASQSEASFWFASLDRDNRMIIHDPVPEQSW